MKLEQQVVSLELAKQLKELGVKQDSLFSYWRVKDDTGSRVTLLKYLEGWEKEYDFYPEIMCSAFTVAELGEMLPSYITHIENGRSGKKYKVELSLHQWINKGEISLWYENSYKYCPCGCGDDDYVVNKGNSEAETEADARAKMLIWLKENKYL